MMVDGGIGYDDTPPHHRARLPADNDGAAKTLRLPAARPTLHCASRSDYGVADDDGAAKLLKSGAAPTPTLRHDVMRPALHVKPVSTTMASPLQRRRREDSGMRSDDVQTATDAGMRSDDSVMKGRRKTPPPRKRRPDRNGVGVGAPVARAVARSRGGNLHLCAHLNARLHTSPCMHCQRCKCTRLRFKL